MTEVGTGAYSAARGVRVFETPLVMTKRLGNHPEKRMTEKRFRYLSGQSQLLIFESPFFRFLGMSPKKLTKNYILLSPFDSKQMVRPHSWRSPKDGPFAPLRLPYKLTNGGRSGILAAFFATFLLRITFSQFNGYLSVTKPLSFGLNFPAKKEDLLTLPFCLPLFTEPQTTEYVF